VVQSDLLRLIDASDGDQAACQHSRGISKSRIEVQGLSGPTNRLLKSIVQIVILAEQA
jgi:hypothetical protein